MKALKRMVSLFSAVAICSLASLAWPQTSQPLPAPLPLIVAGSGVNLGITRFLAKAFMNIHPEITIEVPGSIGTKGAISAVADGAITFGLISRPLNADEKSLGLLSGAMLARR